MVPLVWVDAGDIGSKDDEFCRWIVLCSPSLVGAANMADEHRLEGPRSAGWATGSRARATKRGPPPCGDWDTRTA